MPDENAPGLIPAVIEKTEAGVDTSDLPGRLRVVESRVDAHDHRFVAAEADISALKAGNAELTRQVAGLHTGMASITAAMNNMGADVKLSIERTFNGLLRDALNAVPARVAVWFGAITAAVAVAAVFIQKML